jgi:CRP/FNR family transcriptional regulator
MDRLTLLRSLPLFQGMSDDTLRQVAGESHRRRFDVGETLFYQGDPGCTCHLITKGRVRVYVMDEEGRELSVSILGWGEIVGEMALFEELPRSASVEALEETYTLELHRDVLISCLQRSPALALSMLRDLSARLRHATVEATELASLTVPERLVRRLEQLSAWSGQRVPDGTRISIPLTQQELATLVGTSRESVNRALVRLRKEGKVRTDEGWLVLLDERNADREQHTA